MSYVSASQRANLAVERGLTKFVLVALLVCALGVLFAWTGNWLAKRLYRRSPSAQKTLNMMWRMLGWCITLWAAIHLAIA